MKIVAYKRSGEYCCRPDTTLNHNNSDYYCPDGVTALKAVPCVYTHIDKAGKCVAARFARRYFKSAAFGCLLTDATAGVLPDVATSMDFTSIMDMSFADCESPASGDFTLCVNGSKVYSAGGNRFTEDLAAAIVDITRRTSLRIGDIVAVELCEAVTVASGDIIEMSSSSRNIPIKII